MANDLQYFSPEVWSKRIQNLLSTSLVGTKIANTEETSAVMRAGDRIHRPYMSDVTVQDYTKGTAVTIQDIDSTDEYLDIDKTKVAPIYIDDVDIRQNKYQTASKFQERCAYQIANNIDQAVLAGVTSAALYNSSLITLATTNLVESISNAKVALFNNDVEKDKMCAVLTPDVIGVIEQYCAANGFQKLDNTLTNGFMGNFMGLDIYSSNNLPSSATLGLATQPTDGDTVVINGVTFTFKTTLGTTAGQVLIGASADTANANLTAAINGAAGAGTTYYALSAANRRKLTNKQVTATSNTTTDTIAVTAYGKMTLSETLTDATDAWGDQTTNNLIGQKECIDLVIQENVSTEVKDVQDKLGKNYLTWTLYGTKVFTEGAQRMYDLKIKG